MHSQEACAGGGRVPSALTLVSPEEALSFECKIPGRFLEVTVLRAAGWPVCPAALCGQTETTGVSLRAAARPQACLRRVSEAAPGATAFPRRDAVCEVHSVGRLVQCARMGSCEMTLSL